MLAWPFGLVVLVNCAGEGIGLRGSSIADVIEGPGHWVQLEAVDETNRLVLEFLDQFV